MDFEQCNFEPDSRVNLQQSTALVPKRFQLPREEKAYILLARKGSVIRYPLDRFLLTIANQTLQSPWDIAELLDRATSVAFTDYCLPFYPGEQIWVDGQLKPIVRRSMVKFKKFFALNPIMYQEVVQEYDSECS